MPYRDGIAPHQPTATSAEAAAALENGVRLRAAVLDALRAHPVGLTDEELEDRLGLRHQTVSARRRELVLLGLAGHARDAAGARVRRMNGSGRSAWVWTVLDELLDERRT